MPSHFLLAAQLPGASSSWAPVVLLLIIGIGFVVGKATPENASMSASTWWR
jgi:hypothetical protein